jgi:5,10-methylenetetrahydromethanopterin reductase
MGVGLPKVAVRQAERAEASGWDGLLLVDSQNLAGDCYIGLALAAHATSTLQLATGVTNPFTRHPAVTAGAIATVQAESDGRAVLGIGRGDSSLAHVGLAPAPVAVFERYVSQVQRYLRGEDVPLDEAGAAANTGTVPSVEELHLAGGPASSKLHWLRPNQPKVPVDVAATGPKVIGVAGRHADRVTFAVGADPERVAWAIDTFRAARAAAGLPTDGADGPDLGAYVNVVCHPDRDTARQLGRGGLTSFARFSVMHGTPTGPVAGETAEVLTAVHRNYDMNRHTQAGAAHTGVITAEFADRFAVLGPPDECIDRLQALADLGIRRFAVIGPSADADRAEAASATARFLNEVKPAFA